MRQIAERIKTIKEYINTKALFRNNIVTGKLEYKSQIMQNFKEVDDYALNTMSVELADKNIRCGPSELKDILMSHISPQYNPLTEFLNHLPEWDGKTDFIAALASSVQTTNQAFWVRAFKKWIVALVGSMKIDNVINHTVIVLEGGQGIGKSTWLYNLVPPELKQFRYAGTIKISDKDTLILLSEKVLIILDELASLSLKGLNELKEIITKQDVQIRRPYGRFTESMPRRASFAGSVNEKELLNDPTGSRRFLCFTVKHQINNNHQVDMKMVYAQALGLFISGFQYWFDLNEMEEINKNNEQYRIKPIEEEYLLQTFEPATKNQKCQYLTTSEILSDLNEMYKIPISNTSKMRLGKALKANNFEAVKRNGRQLYIVRHVDKEKQGYLSQIPEIGNKQEFS